LLDFLLGVRAYYYESIAFCLLLIGFYAFYEKLRLNTPLFILLIFATGVHSLGVFGWYNISPIGIPWDYVTHFFPFIIVAVFFFHFLSQYMSEKFTFKALIIILLVFFSTLGIGSVVENVEYVGYLILGPGEGGLKFGTGDTSNIADVERGIEITVGGWYNTMRDLINNLIGAAIGTVLMAVHKYCIPKKKKPERIIKRKAVKLR
jgi:VanZ family protein